MFLLSMFDIWRRLFMLREVQKLFPLLIQTSERPFSVVDFKQIIENLENFPFRHFKQFFIRGCIFVFSKKIPIENVGSGKEGSQTNVKRNNVRNEPTSYHFLNERRKNSFETISLPFCLLLLPFRMLFRPACSRNTTQCCVENCMSQPIQWCVTDLSISFLEKYYILIWFVSDIYFKIYL